MFIWADIGKCDFVWHKNNKIKGGIIKIVGALQMKVLNASFLL